MGCDWGTGTRYSEYSVGHLNANSHPAGSAWSGYEQPQYRRYSRIAETDRRGLGTRGRRPPSQDPVGSERYWSLWERAVCPLRRDARGVRIPSDAPDTQARREPVSLGFCQDPLQRVPQEHPLF